MKTIINTKEVSLAALEKHQVALWMVSRVMDTQAQPTEIIEATAQHFVLKIRVNLQPVQCDRLIINELRDNLPGYTIDVDYKARELTIARAAKKAASKPADDDQQAAA